MENFTPTPYTLECVATGREFEDAGWMLADPQCKEPSLVRTKYARKQIDVKPADWACTVSRTGCPCGVSSKVRRLP